MHCNFCDQTSPSGSLFCKACGSPFHLAPCPNCAAVNEVAAIQCYKCGFTFDVNRVAKISPEDFKKNLIADFDAVAKGVNSRAHPAVTSVANETDETGTPTIQSSAPNPKKSKSPNQPDPQMIRRAVAPTLVHDASYPDTIPLLTKPELTPESTRYPETERQPRLGPAHAIDELPSVDLVARARWGQRALLALLALLCIVSVAYFFLRSEPVVTVPRVKLTPQLTPQPTPQPARKSTAAPNLEPAVESAGLTKLRG